MKHLPNILTISRVFLSVALIFIYTQPLLFFLVYFLAGLTDMTDGYIARTFQVQSPLGATLDSFADLFMFFVCLTVLFLAKIEFPLWLYMSVICIFIIRVINLIITRLRFKRFSILHTTTNKIAGFALWVTYPFFLFIPDLIPLISGFILILALFSSIEEYLIVTRVSTYDVNQKGWKRPTSD